MDTNEKRIQLSPNLNPSSETTEDLVRAHWDLHLLYRKLEPGKGWTREDVVNVHAMVVDELYERKVKHPAPPDEGLDDRSEDFEQHAERNLDWTEPVRKACDPDRDLAIVHGSGADDGPEITVDQVLPHLKDFRLRSPYIYLVGGLAVHGRTRGDIDILIRDTEEIPEALKHTLHFRLGRALPPELSSRLQVHFDKYHGPFTDNVPLYNLLLERTNLTNEVVAMREEVEVEKFWKPFSSPGGKFSWLPVLMKLIPGHKTYVEPYAGSATLFWRKKPSEKEVLSDIDEGVFSIYSFLKSGSDADFEWLRKQSFARTEAQFAKVKAMKPRSLRERAYRYKYLRLMSLRSAGKKLNTSPGTSLTGTSFLASLEKYRERLAKVTVLQKDGLEVIRQFDGPDTFFYIDPPWKDLAADLEHWDRWDGEKFAKGVQDLKGKALISYQGALDLGEKWSERKVSITIPGYLNSSKQSLYRNYVHKAECDLEVEAGVEKAIWSSPGGKASLASKLAGMLPDHGTYVEPFCGSASVLFAKKRSKTEVLNDADERIIEAFRIVQGLSAQQWDQLAKLDWTGKESTYKAVLASSPSTDVEKLHKFLYVGVFSFAKKWGAGFNHSYNGNTSSRAATARKLAERLEGVKLRCGDYAEVIRKFDGPETVFFLDPPYAGHDVKIGEKAFDEEKFFDVLTSIKGKWVLTYGTRGKLPGMLRKEGYRIRRMGGNRALHLPKEREGSYQNLVVTNFQALSKQLEEIPEEILVALEKQDARAASPKFRSQAERAERSDKLTLGEFFYMPKPTMPAFPEELQTLDRFLALYRERESWLPAVAQKKYDGARHQIHRDGDTVRIMSEDGEDNTDRLPKTVAEVKALKAKQFVLDVEIEAWDGRQHLPREVVSAYLHEKGEADDSHLVANVFDVLYLDGDVHKEPLDDRLDKLGGLGIRQSTMRAPNLAHRLNAAPGVAVDTPGDLERAVRRIRRLPGSEGAVVKQRESGYRLKVATADRWVKFRNTTTIKGVVTGRTRTKGGVWVYGYGVLPGKLRPAKTVEAGGRKVAPVGDTFATGQSFDVGDVVLIEAGSVNLTRKGDEVEITAWVPRLIGPAKGADTIEAAASRARSDLVLQEKVVGEGGKVTYKPTRKAVEISKAKTVGDWMIEAGPPNEWSGAVAGILGPQLRGQIERVWRALSKPWRKRVLNAFHRMFEAQDVAMDLDDEIERLGILPMSKQADPYLEIPDEDGTYRFTVQHHHRGKSLHADLRIELDSKRLLGWTFNTQIAGAIKEPVETLEQARAAARRMDEVSKVNWRTGEWAKRERRGTDKPVTTQILCERKAPEPHAWLDVEGKTKEPEEGDKPPVGGTRHYPGVFLIVDKGTIEYGAQKPWFHEYFVRGQGTRTRLILRQLKLGSEVEKALPPSEPEAGAADKANWHAIKPDDQQPYVLDRDAVTKAWIPPVGVSALPKAVRSQIPERFRYWRQKTKAAVRKVRDELVEAIKRKEVKLDYSAPYKRAVTKASTSDARFVLQEQSWRGPIQIRVGPSKRLWWLRLDIGRPELVVLRLYNNPLDNDQVAARLEHDRHRDSMTTEGDLKPGHYLNPTKETPSHLEILDSGKAEVLSISGSYLKVRIRGKKLSGLYGATRNNGEWLWAPTEEGPAVEKYLVEMQVEIQKVEKWKRLATGIVLEPDEVDAQKDWERAATIERAAHKFLAKYNRETKLGLMHRIFGMNGLELVESWIAPADLVIGKEKVKKGTWLMTVKVVDDQVWQDVLDRKITGFSIGGVATVAS
jgi:site-specific DNA-adenine methylase